MLPHYCWLLCLLGLLALPRLAFATSPRIVQIDRHANQISIHAICPTHSSADAIQLWHGDAPLPIQVTVQSAPRSTNDRTAAPKRTYAIQASIPSDATTLSLRGCGPALQIALPNTTGIQPNWLLLASGIIGLGSGLIGGLIWQRHRHAATPSITTPSIAELSRIRTQRLE
jgi:hypothetical protein